MCRRNYLVEVLKPRAFNISLPSRDTPLSYTQSKVGSSGMKAKADGKNAYVKPNWEGSQTLLNKSNADPPHN